MYKFDRRLFFFFFFFLFLFYRLFDFFGFFDLFDLFRLSVVFVYFPFLSFLLRLRWRRRNNYRLFFFHLRHDLAAWLSCHLFLKEIEQKLRVRLFEIFIFVVSGRGSFLRNCQKYQRHSILPYLCRMLHLKDLHDTRLLTFCLPLQKHKIMKDKRLSDHIKSGNNLSSYV